MPEQMTVPTIIAIDPGPEQSAYVRYQGGASKEFGKIDNAELLTMLRRYVSLDKVLVVEQVASFGMAVGAEVFETVFWSGRFIQCWGGDWDRVKRHEVKQHLCHNQRAKDANIRQAIIDRYGGKDKAIGKKKTPGPLYGMSGDCWSALAVAITYAETKWEAR